uniref:(northern house mosquito) hypothetical protein n=1 Tax=Culex pipiens TaxID=7175 RepID=A0A8D8HH33_CULPI
MHLIDLSFQEMLAQFQVLYVVVYALKLFSEKRLTFFQLLEGIPQFPITLCMLLPHTLDFAQHLRYQPFCLLIILNTGSQLGALSAAQEGLRASSPGSTTIQLLALRMPVSVALHTLDHFVFISFFLLTAGTHDRVLTVRHSEKVSQMVR